MSKKAILLLLISTGSSALEVSAVCLPPASPSLCPGPGGTVPLEVEAEAGEVEVEGFEVCGGFCGDVV